MRGIFIALVGIVAFYPSGVLADTFVSVNPAGVRLQNFVPGSIQVFGGGSTCVNGSMNFSSSATPDDKNRFWSMMLTSKQTGKPVGIYYETISGQCNITSFFQEN